MLICLLSLPGGPIFPWLLHREDCSFLFQLNLGFYLNFSEVCLLMKSLNHKYFTFYYLLHQQFIFEIRFSLKCIPTLVFRIFVYAKNDFNHIKEEFLDYQRRNNSSVSPSQAIGCTCPFTGFSQPSCPQLSTCPYLQERATKSFIL